MDQTSGKYFAEATPRKPTSKPRLASKLPIDITEISELIVEIDFSVPKWTSDGGLMVEYKRRGSNTFTLLTTNKGSTANPLNQLKRYEKKASSSIRYNFDVSNLSGEILIRIINNGSDKTDTVDFHSIRVSGA